MDLLYKRLYDFIKAYKADNIETQCYSPCDWAIDDALSIPLSLAPVRYFWKGDTIPRLVGGTQCKCHRLLMRQALHLIITAHSDIFL